MVKTMNNNIFQAINVICEAENNESDFCLRFADYSVSGCRVDTSDNSETDYKILFELTDETYLYIHLESIKIVYCCCLFSESIVVDEFKTICIDVSGQNIKFTLENGKELEIAIGEDYE